MIIRGTPKNKNKDNYINKSIEEGIILHKNGVVPVYIDKEFMWFKKEDLEGGEFKNER